MFKLSREIRCIHNDAIYSDMGVICKLREPNSLCKNCKNFKVREKNIKSYESSGNIIKMWRCRWYLYAILLYLGLYININIIVDYLIDDELTDNDKEKIRKEWKLIKKHVEITKMYKYSVK